MAADQRVTDAYNLVQGSCAAGVDVSCSTSLPKSPDRIAGIKKPKALTSGLNFFASERLNGFPALGMNLTSFSGDCNSYFPQNSIFIENTHYFVTRERMTSAYDSC
ncbi:hypothetical protein KFX88_28375, partial [Klebsiella pneumoniae]|uniref:hypothetical protein n=1 Tax=Klebsiella pneumoniae TaxID=573 RepID=UPI001BA6D2E5